MRDYRGKVKGVNTPKSRWAYGDKFKIGKRVFIVLDDAYIGCVPYGQDILYGFIEVIPETVGQSIGKKDEIDAKIYEGDVVSCYFQGNEYFGFVEWDNERVAFTLRGTSVNSRGGRMIMTWKDQDCIKVIGNITDNPELMENKDEV